MSDCCKVPTGPHKRESQPICPQCGRAGKPVDRITILALLKPEALADVNSSQHGFCENPGCPVVYFAPDGAQFGKNRIRVRVGIKETEDPITVCYCFGVTERMIRDEISRTGISTAAIRIRAEVKAGTCRCAVENPSGRCCLGEVVRVEKRAATESKERAALQLCDRRSLRMRPSVKTPDQIGAIEPLPTKTARATLTASSAGGLLAALLASICCIGPVVFAALGVGVGATGFLASTTGFLKALLLYRPLFMGLAMVFLGVGFYVAYRKPTGAPCQACGPAPGSRRNRLLLWIITGFAAALMLAPYWLELMRGS